MGTLVSPLFRHIPLHLDCCRTGFVTLGTSFVMRIFLRVQRVFAGPKLFEWYESVTDPTRTPFVPELNLGLQFGFP